MNGHRPARQSRRPSPARGVVASRRGFTLTELLVATAITLIILLIFAQIYRSATATIVEQRGLAQNDARSRMLSTLIRSDLQKCSFRDHATSTSVGLHVLTTGDVADSAQQGYVYYSENDADNDTDDVLQFTTLVDVIDRNKDEHPYYGKASRIGRPSGATSPGPGTFSLNDRNQPEFDDGDTNNDASQSRSAEIAYFLRAGTLYRRVLLLRDPLASTSAYSGQPTMDLDGAGGDLIPGDYDTANADLTDTTNAYGDFWNDFDYSAIHDGTLMQFNSIAAGTSSLDNIAYPTPIALPAFRFGFRTDTQRPREYSGATFIGRFVQEETSHPNFGWPGIDPAAMTHPYKRTDLTFNSRGIATQYLNGPRVGEDILLPNVDGFDVKIWDPAVQQFVDLGYGRAANVFPGYFDHAHNFRKDYGPRAVNLGADGQPGVSGADDDSDGTSDNATEIGWPGSDDVINRVFDTWHPAADVTDSYPADDASSPYSAAGTNLYPAYRPLLSQGPNYVGPAAIATVYSSWAAVADPVPQNTLLFPYGDPYSTTGYLCTTAGAKGGAEPSWPTTFGQYVNDGSAVWQVVDNRVGATILQITVRFRDVGSNLPRQLTIIHSFTE